MKNYIFLGILQGIFEWIPVSSEGIAALVGDFLMPQNNPIELALFLHLGTLMAVLLYFRKDWKRVFTLQDPQFLSFLIISSLSSLAVGFPLYILVQKMTVGNSLLVLTGVGLLLTAYFHKKERRIRIGSRNLALLSGLLQGLAVIPGLSRSASTIFGLSLGKEDPSRILKISYMMSLPVILASSIYLYWKNPSLFFEGWPALVSSFLTGLLTLRILIDWSQKTDFFRFVLFFSLLCFLGAFLVFIM